MSSKIFCAAIVRNINSNQQWRLQIRGTECIITYCNQIMLFCYLADCLNIDNLQCRVCRCFYPNHFCFGFYCFFNIFNIGHVNEIDSDSKFILSINSHVSLSSTIYIITNDKMIPTFKDMQNRRCCSTSTGICNTIFSVLYCSQAFLNSISCWISSSSIIKLSIRVSHIFLSICRCSMDGYINTAMDWLWFASLMNCKSRESFMLSQYVILFREFLELNLGL